jgi:hypothetical protein
MNHLESYLNQVKSLNSKELADSIEFTVNSVMENNIRNFDFNSHLTGLLLGNVQSGKTSQMFGIIAASASLGFPIFTLLTTDNILLQKQTFERALKFLDTFNICSEDDFIRFKSNQFRKPTLIILKKNKLVLERWIKDLTPYLKGNPLFIMDDEADAASLNTKINQKEISTINGCIQSLRTSSASSIYLQVTATPQAVLLQKLDSAWRPKFVHYFKPGPNYIGGDFFFSKEIIPNYIKLTDDEELQDLLKDDEFPVNGLYKALCTFLLISAQQIDIEKLTVSSFLIHPSIKIVDHQQIADKISNYLNRLLLEFSEKRTPEFFNEIYNDIQNTFNTIADLNTLLQKINNNLNENLINIIILNSKNITSDYTSGTNIIIGGNSLGRGVTFPNLQVVYYSRTSKVPQADTYWQHSRIFGYDRNPKLLRLFMPPVVYKLFSELNESNNSIINQITKGNINEIQMINFGKTKPTRSNIIDISELTLITGGTNYFPFEPINSDIDELNTKLAPFSETELSYDVHVHFLQSIISLVSCNRNEIWANGTISDCLNAYTASKPSEQCILIVRRNRSIGKNTGTLLSPNDRILGGEFKDKIVLTIYKIKGDKGWDGDQIWIPNIKFPEGINFYSLSNGK